MSQIRSATATIASLLGPFAMMLLGAVISASLFRAGEPGKDDRALPPHVGRAFLGEDGEAVHVALSVGPGSTMRNLVLQTPEGRELATLHVSRDGAFSVEPSATGRSRFVLHRRTSGSVDLGWLCGERALGLDTRTDGTADLYRKDARGKMAHVAHLDENGRIDSTLKFGRADEPGRLDELIGPDRGQP